jgi:hypothetical protein
MLESHDLSGGNTKFLYFVNVGTPALAWIRNALFDRNHETGILYSSAGLQFMLHSFTSDRDLEDRFWDRELAAFLTPFPFLGPRISFPRGPPWQMLPSFRRMASVLVRLRLHLGLRLRQFQVCTDLDLELNLASFGHRALRSVDGLQDC